MVGKDLKKLQELIDQLEQKVREDEAKKIDVGNE